MLDLAHSILHASPELGGLGLSVAAALAEWPVWVGPAVLVLLWAAGGSEDRAAAVFAAVAGAVGLVAAAVLSPVVAEPRPFVDGSVVNHLHHVADYGFPSDHATLAFSLAFGLLLHRPPMLPRVWLALAAAALAIGWARVFLGAHQTVDILGAAIVGFVAAWVTGTRIGSALISRLVRLGEAVRSGALMRLRGPRRAG